MDNQWTNEFKQLGLTVEVTSEKQMRAEGVNEALVRIVVRNGERVISILLTRPGFYEGHDPLRPVWSIAEIDGERMRELGSGLSFGQAGAVIMSAFALVPQLETVRVGHEFRRIAS